jgi:rare lipoprotein A
LARIRKKLARVRQRIRVR